MNNDHMKDVLTTIARRGVPENTNLWPKLSARLERKSPMTILRTRPFAAILIALFVLLALSGVVYAIGNMLGYIPGIGFVNLDAPVRMLLKPVSVTRNGVTITIENGYMDVDQTVLSIRVQSQSVPISSTNCHADSDYLLLPDGRKFPALKNITGWNSDSRMFFPPLPSGVTTVELQLGCPPSPFPDRWWPGDWKTPAQFVLQFRDATESDVLPVNEISSTALADATATASTAKPASYGLLLILEKTVELQDGYILMGNVSWSDLNLDEFAIVDADKSIEDANGEPVAFEQVHDPMYQDSSKPGERRMPWALKIIGKEHAWPITLTFQTVARLPSDEVLPQLDLGNEPVFDRPVILNWDVSLHGYSFQVISVTPFKNPDDGAEGLNFEMNTADKNLYIVSLWDKDRPVLGGGSNRPGFPYATGFLYDGSIPREPLTIRVIAVTVLLPDYLQVTWQP
jgi:hypothetical protein